jgi:TPR repeat protein
MGIAENAAKAADLWRQACDGKVAGACYDLGVATQSGLGVTRDRERARNLYQSACDLGDKRGCDKVKYR